MGKEKKIIKYQRHTVCYYSTGKFPFSLSLCHLLIRRIMLFEWDNGEQWEFSSPLGIIATCLLDSRRKLQRSGGRGKRFLGQLKEVMCPRHTGAGLSEARRHWLCVSKEWKWEGKTKNQSLGPEWRFLVLLCHMVTRLKGIQLSDKDETIAVVCSRQKEEQQKLAYDKRC